MKARWWSAISAAAILVSCNQKPADQNGSPEQFNQTGQQPVSADSIASELVNGNFAQAAEMARSATRATPADPQYFLLLARAEARLGNLGYAVEALDNAFKQGFHDPRGAVNHPDFDKIRSSAAFQQLLRQWRISTATTPKAAAQSAPASVTRAGDVSIVEQGGRTRIQAGDVVIED